MEEVEVVFESDPLIAQYGRHPKKIPLEMAQRYAARGLVKILTIEPDANPPSPQIFEPNHINAHPPPMKVLSPVTANNSLIARIAWISSIRLPKGFVKFGEGAGFSVDKIVAKNFDVNSLVGYEFIIVGSDLSKFNKSQKRQLRIVLFQRQVPFCLYCDSGPKWGEVKWLMQAILSSKFLFFRTDEAKSSFKELLGEVVEVFPVEDDASALWKKVDEVTR